MNFLVSKYNYQLELYLCLHLAKEYGEVVMVVQNVEQLSQELSNF